MIAPMIMMSCYMEKPGYMLHIFVTSQYLDEQPKNELIRMGLGNYVNKEISL